MTRPVDLDALTLDGVRAGALDGVPVTVLGLARSGVALARFLHDAARERGLLTTGSADFHGPEHERFATFGAFELYGLEPELGPILSGAV